MTCIISSKATGTSFSKSHPHPHPNPYTETEGDFSREAGPSAPTPILARSTPHRQISPSHDDHGEALQHGLKPNPRSDGSSNSYIATTPPNRKASSSSSYTASPIRHSPLSQPPLYAPSRTPSPGPAHHYRPLSFGNDRDESDQYSAGNRYSYQQGRGYNLGFRKRGEEQDAGNGDGLRHGYEDGFGYDHLKATPNARGSPMRHVSSPLNSMTASQLDRIYLIPGGRPSYDDGTDSDFIDANAPPTLSPPSVRLSRSQPLLGSYPLSLLHSRMSHAHPARQSTEPFTLHLTAVGKGKSCSSELRRPEPLEIAFGATYHDLVMDNNGSASGGRGGPRSSPWVGNIDIEKHFIDSFSTTLIGSHNENSRHLNLPTSNSSPISFGKITPIPAIASSAPLIRPAPLPTYNNSIGHSLTHVSLPRTSAPPEIPGYKVAPVGQLQILIKSLSVPIKVFIVPYDLRHLSAGSRLLVGEKSYLVSGSELKSRAPAASPGSLLISEARGMGKGKSKESLKSAIQLQFVCCSTASTPGPEPASVRAPAKEQVRSPGHLSYYVAKSIRVVFSSPSHTADEMRTERHDEVVKPPVPTAASSPEREIGIVDDAALLFPHGLDRQPATSGVSARPEIERLRDIGWQGESLHDRYDHENDRNEPSIKRRDSLGKGNQKEGGGLLLSSFSPGSSSLGRRLEWEMIRRRWFAKSQSQVPQDDDKRNEQVFATQDALDNNQEDGNGNDKDVLVGHTENLTANAHTPISQPQSDQHQTNLNFDPNLVRRQFTKAIEPIRPSLERKPSLLSTTQPDSLQASVPTAPLAGRVQRKDGQMTSAPSEAMGPAEPTHLPSSEVTTLSIAGKGDRDGAGNRASSPSPLPPPISIVSPTPHKIALDGHGHGHGHFKSKNASQSHLSFSLSAKRTSGPKPSAIATSSSSRSRTASPIPPSSSSSAARATVGIINDNQRERERERGRASTATPPLIWSPTSNVNRRMTREDGQEEVELSEKLRKMGLDVSRR